MELRAAERGRSLLKAKIIFNNRMSTVDCIIKNISAGGARIAVGSTLSLPNEFDLDVPLKGKTYRAQMRWRDAENIGVEFTDGASAAETSDSRLHRLEEENMRLRTTIQSLSKRLADLGQDV